MDVKPPVVYDVEDGMDMEPMQWKWVSFRDDLVYTELFCNPEGDISVLLVL